MPHLVLAGSDPLSVCLELSRSVGRAGVTLRPVRVRESVPGLVTTLLVIAANGGVFAPRIRHLFRVSLALVTTHVPNPNTRTAALAPLALDSHLGCLAAYEDEIFYCH